MVFRYSKPKCQVCKSEKLQKLCTIQKKLEKSSDIIWWIHENFVPLHQRCKTVKSIKKLRHNYPENFSLCTRSFFIV